MAITCPHCGAEYDATLFQFGRRIRCTCGADVEYPGMDLSKGHIAADGKPPQNFLPPNKHFLREAIRLSIEKEETGSSDVLRLSDMLGGDFLSPASTGSRLPGFVKT